MTKEQLLIKLLIIQTYIVELPLTIEDVTKEEDEKLQDVLENLEKAIRKATRQASY